MHFLELQTTVYIKKMIKPKKLTKGDKVALVSLSSGMAGDSEYIHRYYLGKKRLEEEFKLKVVTMPNALKGSKYIEKHPEKRAEDLINAFNDKEIKGVICIAGGNDALKVLPYVDFETIKNNPKVFMGYSDSTINHFMMYKANITSYYGPAVISEFAENYKMHKYTKKYIKKILFKNKKNIIINSSKNWTSEFLDWAKPENDNIKRKMQKERHGFEILQGKHDVEGELLGGCLNVLPNLIGTLIWPNIDEWQDKVLFLETSPETSEPERIIEYLQKLFHTGIFNKIAAIIVGKPYDESYYEEYKEVYIKFINDVVKRHDLPILYNVNIGHTAPMCIFPLGQKIKIDLKNREIIFTEKPMNN